MRSYGVCVIGFITVDTHNPNDNNELDPLFDMT